MTAHDATTQHEAYIRRCLELAGRAVQSGNGPFAAVLVRDRRVIAEGHNQVRSLLDVSAHGEIVAIRQACRALGTLDLTGCTLYTNAEPCYMCAFAIRVTRISRVVIGARAPHSGGVSSPYPILSATDVLGWAPPPDIVRDVLGDECAAWLRACGFDHI